MFNRAAISTASMTMMSKHTATKVSSSLMVAGFSPRRLQAVVPMASMGIVVVPRSSVAQVRWCSNVAPGKDIDGRKVDADASTKSSFASAEGSISLRDISAADKEILRNAFKADADKRLDDKLEEAASKAADQIRAAIKKKAMEDGVPVPEEVADAPLVAEEEHNSEQSHREKAGLLKQGKKNQMGGAGMGPKEADMVAIFTCSVCEHRTAKRFTKHAYTKGIVIVQCPGCTARHLLADNLGWFEENDKKNIEEILAEKGEQVTKVQGGLHIEELFNADGTPKPEAAVDQGPTPTIQ